MYVVCNLKEKPQSIMCKLRDANNEILYRELPFNNFFYILEKDFDTAGFHIENMILKTEIINDKDGVAYRKLILKNNYHRNIVRKKLEEDLCIKTFEADINAPKRFLILNQQVKLHQDKLNYTFVDIETFDLTPLEKDFKGGVIAVEPILSCAFKDMDGNVEYYYNKAIDNYPKELVEKYRLHIKNRGLMNEDEKLKMFNEFRQGLLQYEKEMLIEIMQHAIKHDVLLAWNGNRFDYTYLEQRMKKYGLEYESLDVHSIDYMEVFKKNSWDSLKSFSLNNVAKHTFRDELKNDSGKFDLSELTKIDWREKTGLKRFFELYLFEQQLFKEYNIQDVNLMFLMEIQLKFLKIQEVSSELCHCLISSTVWNSHMCDFLFLNEYKNQNIIKCSKPSREEIENRKHPTKGIYPSGGFTRCFLPGLHFIAEVYDFKSMYPCHIITFGISPENLVGEEYPDLQLVFDEYEIEFIEAVNKLGTKFLDSKGSLSKGKYEKAMEELRASIEQKAVNKKTEGGDVGYYKLRTMTELMWHFVSAYNNTKLLEKCKKENLVFTPADINYDTRGWCIHPHRMFKKEKSVMAGIQKFLLTTRDKAKYDKKTAAYHSANWWAHEFFQLAIKTIGNSMFGYTSFKSSREFSYEIPDAITSSSRFTLKKCIIYAIKHNYKCVLCDTDSLFLSQVKDIKQLEIEYFKLLNSYTKEFNCDAQVEIKNPETGEMVKSNHFLVLEREKMYSAIVAIKKKRYYYKIEDKNQVIYDTQGGAFKKTDTIKLAADLQKELVKDILDEKYDKNKWINKLAELKTKVYNFELEKEYIIKTAGLSRRVEEYGKPVIDGKTGKQKLRKSDGMAMFAPIPAHVKVIKRLQDAGQVIEVGDKVDFVVKKATPRIEAISLAEYDAHNEYDADYYWDRIIKPIIEILNVMDPISLYSDYSKCWNYNEKQLKKLVDKLGLEDDEEEVEK